MNNIIPYTINSIQPEKLLLSKTYCSNGIKYKFKLCESINITFDMQNCNSRSIYLQIPKNFGIFSEKTSFSVQKIGSYLTYCYYNSNDSVYEEKTVCLICAVDDYNIEIILSDDITNNTIIIKKLNLIIIPQCLTSRCLCIDFSYFRFICNEMDDIDDEQQNIIGNMDLYITESGVPLIISYDSNGVLINDIPYNDTNLQAILCNGPFNGNLIWDTVNLDGTFEYTSDSTFSGFDIFTYKPSINGEYGNETFVKIFVYNTNDCFPIVITDDNYICINGDGINCDIIIIDAGYIQVKLVAFDNTNPANVRINGTDDPQTISIDNQNFDPGEQLNIEFGLFDSIGGLISPIYVRSIEFEICSVQGNPNINIKLYNNTTPVIIDLTYSYFSGILTNGNGSNLEIYSINDNDIFVLFGQNFQLFNKIEIINISSGGARFKFCNLKLNCYNYLPFI